MSRNQLTPGQRVHVASLGTGIIREVRNGGQCLVELKGRAVLLPCSALAPADAVRTKKPKHDSGGTRALDEPASVTGVSSIDLHGRTVPEALEALDAFLSDALLAGVREVHVIHGRSGGRIRQAVHQRLTHLPSIHLFRLDPGNPGVTIVTL